LRLAVHTYPFRELPLSAALDEVAGLGIEDVDLWLGHAEPDVDAAAAELERRGLRAVAVSAGGFYEPDDRHAARTFAVAARVGAPVVAACLAPGLAPWVEERLPAGVTVAVENHWYQPLALSNEVLGEIAAQHLLGACLDTGHALVAGERPDRAARSLGERLAHIHLKDARLPRAHERLAGRRVRRRLLARPEPTPPGRGALDVDALRRTLRELGYRGAVAVEFEGRQPAAALRALIDAWRRADSR
jgi:sugar phosphate isomerase/epimerase